ncbi:MAG: hypothetical protein ACP5PX_04930 [Candidatus Hadarchaeum sp.]|uniref:hypothetical protein n=1 Tax=Candidatus Hadarchaeum sp. TaxID=2883567 RepID=UPI003D0A6C49
MTEKVSKYAAYLEDQSVRRWFNNLSRGSPITADVALRRLSKLCELLGTTPRGMVQRARGNLTEFQDALEDMISSGWRCSAEQYSKMIRMIERV